MEQYLIDTNVISDYLSSSLTNAGSQFMDDVIDRTANFSVVSEIELLSWKAEPIIAEKVKILISRSVILDISRTVVDNSVILRRAIRIKTPDAIIAGTALALGYTLVTINEKDFAGVPGLRLMNPMRM